MKTSVLLFLTDILPEKRNYLSKIVKNKIFDGFTTEEVFSHFKKSGIDGIELLLPPNVKPQDIGDTKKITTDNGIEIYSVHQALRFLTVTKIDEIIKLFEIAKTLNAKVVVLHMNSVGKQIFDQDYIDEIHVLERKYNIKVGFENGEKYIKSLRNRHWWSEVEFAELMVKQDLYITLDTCHLGQSGGDVVSFFKKNKNRIVNIHISDYKSNILNNSLRPLRFKHLPLGKGELPLKEFIAVLKQQNYKGLLTMEIETELRGLMESADYIRKAS